MVSLQLKGGSKVEVEEGFVDINGPCVCLYKSAGKKGPILVKSYCMNPGEDVHMEKEGEYIVSF